MSLTPDFRVPLPAGQLPHPLSLLPLLLQVSLLMLSPECPLPFSLLPKTLRNLLFWQSSMRGYPEFKRPVNQDGGGGCGWGGGMPLFSLTPS